MGFLHGLGKAEAMAPPSVLLLPASQQILTREAMGCGFPKLNNTLFGNYPKYPYEEPTQNVVVEPHSRIKRKFVHSKY